MNPGSAPITNMSSTIGDELVAWAVRPLTRRNESVNPVEGVAFPRPARKPAEMLHLILTGHRLRRVSAQPIVTPRAVHGPFALGGSTEKETAANQGGGKDLSDPIHGRSTEQAGTMHSFAQKRPRSEAPDITCGAAFVRTDRKCRGWVTTPAAGGWR